MKKALRLSSLVIVLTALLTLVACAPKEDKVVEKMESKGYYTLTTTTKDKVLKDLSDLEDVTVKTSYLFATAEDNSMQAEEMKGEYVCALYFDTKNVAKDAFDAVKGIFEKDGIKVKKSGNCIYFGTAQGMKDFA